MSDSDSNITEIGAKGKKAGRGRPPVHGGRAAIDALASGAPFKGAARREELRVLRLLRKEGGTVELLTAGVARLEAVSRLYWVWLNVLLDSGDLGRVDTCVTKLGWLQGAAIRAAATLAQAQKSAAGESLETLLGKVVDSE